jgi:hypothetical protein
MDDVSRRKGAYRTAWGTWYSMIQIAGERIYLGSFDTQEEAAAAYASALARRGYQTSPLKGTSTVTI